ncbi:MAG: Unknown protein [uncultured Sulfurovum sp.]|uniref:Uncharacterized protein n=1 Tax=uncultured Sulfurovum sp. TaxID=269237 RepID=A0A6S6SVQ4_9BACT|nr:MAG: Unknown protein [uncultured Sulfurovum sp.]
MPFEMTDSKEKQVHATEIFNTVRQRDPYATFQGNNPDSNIIVLIPESRDASTVTMQIVTDLTGDGTSGNQDVSDDHEEMETLPFTFKGELITKSTKSPKTVLMKKTTAGVWRSEKKNKIINWFTRYSILRKAYAFSFNPTNVVCVKKDGTISNKSEDLVVGCKFDTQYVDEALKRAKNGYIDDEDVEHPELLPFTEVLTRDGKFVQTGAYYPFFVGPESWESLSDDPIYKEYQKTKALATGDFKGVQGFVGEYKGAVFIELGKMTDRRAGCIRSDSPDFKKYIGFDQYKAGDGTVTELNHLLGCGAGGQGFDLEPQYEEDPTEDNNQKVVALANQFFGFEKVRWLGETTEEKKSIYHDKDYATIVAIATIK